MNQSIKFVFEHDIPTKTSIVPLSTHAHYSKTETSDDIHELARTFLLSLEPGELLNNIENFEEN